MRVQVALHRHDLFACGNIYTILCMKRQFTPMNEIQRREYSGLQMRVAVLSLCDCCDLCVPLMNALAASECKSL